LGGQFAATERVIVMSIKLVRINRTVGIALAIVALANAAPAQQTLKILTPSDDSCAVFMIAMDSDDPPKVLALGGWALGFLSGVVQGTGVDFLKGATSEVVMNRLYADCKKAPTRPMSFVLEEMARSLVAAHQGSR
jgi:hypothetical protein